MEKVWNEGIKIDRFVSISFHFISENCSSFYWNSLHNVFHPITTFLLCCSSIDPQWYSVCSGSVAIIDHSRYCHLISSSLFINTLEHKPKHHFYQTLLKFMGQHYIRMPMNILEF